ncbi:hypothetical protein L218DRAFT_1008377 [Marasmius fiardii PR-910]|nr:hypothetical protein L218DRAFT_1008377 [Marasmius fiardii PR-910]
MEDAGSEVEEGHYMASSVKENDATLAPEAEKFKRSFYNSNKRVKTWMNKATKSKESLLERDREIEEYKRDLKEKERDRELELEIQREAAVKKHEEMASLKSLEIISRFSRL